MNTAPAANRTAHSAIKQFRFRLSIARRAIPACAWFEFLGSEGASNTFSYLPYKSPICARPIVQIFCFERLRFTGRGFDFDFDGKFARHHSGDLNKSRYRNFSCRRFAIIAVNNSLTLARSSLQKPIANFFAEKSQQQKQSYGNQQNSFYPLPFHFKNYANAWGMISGGPTRRS